MSLHNASKHIASKGRGEDTMLVHMTPGEVKGLQQLALAQGGSLTINPETGLVEAGILKKILPMVGGAALMMIPGMQGFGGALAASAIMGGGMYAATGSIKEGLLAGLGAFGGANIASGLAAAGAGAAEAGAAGALEAGVSTGAASGAGAAGSTLPLGMTSTTTGAFGSAAPLGSSIIPSAYGSAGSGLVGGSAAGIPTVASGSAGAMGGAMGGVNLAGTPVATSLPQAAQPTFMGNLQAAGRGLPELGNVIMASPMKTLGAAAAPFAFGSVDSGVEGFPPDEDTSSSGYSLSPNFQAYSPTQPNPYPRAQYTDYRRRGVGAFAEGGIAGLATGGMDPMDPIQNPIYPQSQQVHTNFATSSQYPNSMQSAMASDYDTRTNPRTGQELPMGMASGGKTKTLSSSPSMPSGGVYRDTDPDTASKDAYQAALIKLQKANKGANIKPTEMPKARLKGLGDMPEMASGGVARYDDGGAAASGASGIPAGMGGEAAGALLDYAGLPAPAAIPSGLGGLSASAPDTMAALAAMNPFGGQAPIAPTQYVDPYAGRPIHMPQATTNYVFDRPIATAESIAREEAVRREAERIAAEQAAQSQSSEGNYHYWNYAAGGQVPGYNLGGYSDGGRMLKGPGDGMSDSIPASIGKRQPARLADGEFVVPADVVSHLGNGSTDAGAKKLYGMMDKVRKARTGTKKQGKQIKADKYLPK